MSIVDAYLRLVARWRWSFLLALLIGSFMLQAILPNGPVTRLTGFTLFMLVFGGALYAGRTGRRATRAAIALLLAAAALQILNVLGVAALEGPLAVAGADHRPRRPGRDLRGARQQPRRHRRQPGRRDLRLLRDRRRLRAAVPPDGGRASRILPPARRRGPRHPDALFQPHHRDHRRLRRHHPGHPDRADLRRARSGARHALSRHPDRPHRRADWRLGCDRADGAPDDRPRAGVESDTRVAPP